MVAKDSAPGLFMVMATSRGIVKKTSLDKFASVRSNGLIAMKLQGEEELVGASVVAETDKLILITQSGQAIKFGVRDLRTASRTSGGVRGIRLSSGDRMVGMSTVFPNAHLLTVTENGYGKRSRVSTYPLQARGGKGVVGHKINEKTGRVITANLVPQGQHIIIISARGIVIRISVDEEVSLLGRATQGVHLNKLGQDDRVVSVACIQEGEDRGDDKAAAE